MLLWSGENETPVGIVVPMIINDMEVLGLDHDHDESEGNGVWIVIERCWDLRLVSYTVNDNGVNGVAVDGPVVVGRPVQC